MEQHWLVRPTTIRGLWLVFIGLLAATVLAQLVTPAEHHAGIERLLGFNAWYGLISCAATIVGAKALGWLLKRPDGYYDD
jgi:hypothetical protein